MSIHKLKLSFICMFVLCLALSCQDNEVADHRGIIPAGHSKLMLNLPAGIATRATEAGSSEEDRAASADLFVFKDGLLDEAFTDLKINSSGAVPIVTTLVQGGGARNVYLILNSTGAVALRSLTVGSTTEEQLKSLLTDKITGLPVAPFIMSASKEGVALKEGELTVVELLPERLVARLDVHAKAEGLAIESVALVNAPAQSAYYTLPPDAVIPTFVSSPVEPQEGVTNLVKLYSFESSPADASAAMALEVKGRLGADAISYRLDLLDAVGSPVTLVRNNIYTINITKATPTTSTLSVEIKVKPWVLSPDIIDLELPGAEGFELKSHASLKKATTFDEAGSLFETAARGDELNLTFPTTGAGADVQVQADAAGWITPERVSDNGGEATWKLKIAANDTGSKRRGVVTLRSGAGFKEYAVSQFDPATDRYWVVAVAGQSNALGYDESPKETGEGGLDAPVPGAYQLGLRDEDNLKVIRLEAFPQDLQNMGHITDASGQKGVKGVHLPLAKLLLEKAPAGYNILVIPTAYGGTGFHSGMPAIGYNSTTMLPTVTASRARWGKDQAFFYTMRDRVKHVLKTNDANKFIGVVWCQGEEDIKHPSAQHYKAFSEMADAFFSDLNGAGLGSRCPQGVAGKHIWYNYSTAPYFYHVPLNPQQGQGQVANAFRGSSVFGGYKVWNPDTFIHVPEDYNLTNFVNGTGHTMVQRGAHFGNNAFSSVIAPMIMDCMLYNNGLTFGPGTLPADGTRYTHRLTRSEANAATGSLGELQSGLMLYLPFDGTQGLTVNRSPEAGRHNATVTNKNMVLQRVSGFPAPDGGSRSRDALQFRKGVSESLTVRLPGQTNASWTLSFLLKRNSPNESAALISGGASVNNRLYMGFKPYVSESCGNLQEFIVEPSYSKNTDRCGTGRLMNADRVRSYADWIHYATSFDAGSKRLTVYMNGQKVYEKTLTGVGASDISELMLKGDVVNYELLGLQDAYMAELYIWNRVLTPQHVEKNYIMSYFGVAK